MAADEVLRVVLHALSSALLDVLQQRRCLLVSDGRRLDQRVDRGAHGADLSRGPRPVAQDDLRVVRRFATPRPAAPPRGGAAGRAERLPRWRAPATLWIRTPCI